MSLTFPAVYSATLKSASIKEDWLLQLYNDIPAFIGLSGTNRRVSGVQYYGVVNDFGSISKQIDIVNSRASTGTITITCQNVFKNDTLSAVLFGSGADKYLSYKVLIYSCLNDETTLANCALLDEMRLVHINHNQDEVVLTLEDKSSWDYISIPNIKNDIGDYVPVVYGDYSPEVSSPGSENFLEEHALHPAPIVAVRGDDIAAHVTRNIAVDGNPHIYERSIDGFAPLNPVDDTAESFKSSNVITAPLNIERAFKFRPLIEVDVGANRFTNPDRAIDTDVSNYASVTESLGDNQASAYYIYAKIPQIPGGKFTDINIGLKYYAECDDYNGSGLISLYDISYGTGATQQHEIFTLTVVGVSDGTAYVTKAWDTADRYNSSNSLPSKFILKATFQTGSSGGDSIGGYIWVYDMYIYGTVELTFDASNYESSMAFLNQINMFYCGGDGLTKSYAGGAGTTSLPHEIHRDMLNRYTGFDYADTYMQGFSATTQYLNDHLNSARLGWACRAWVLEPTELKEVLERLQYEGCFIFRPIADSDGSGNPGGSYIWVHDTYASGDVTYTLDEKHYINLSIDVVPFSDIISKAIYNHQRHPAKNGIYYSSTTYTNSTRAEWNYATEENIAEIDIDYLVGSTNGTNNIYDSASGDNTPNESIVLYYDNINGKTKQLVSCTITDKSKFDLDLGDIVQFNDSDIDPFNNTWSNIYFIIISTDRSIEGLGIVTREVYSL